MYPFWLFNVQKELDSCSAPPPPNRKVPLDDNDTLKFCYAGQIVRIIDDKNNTICYVVKSVDPLKLERV